MALSLWCEGKGALSHGAAAYLLKLKIPATNVLEASVSTRGKPPRGDISLHQGIPLPKSDYHRMNGMLVTTATRTLVDLASRLTEEQLEIAVDDAFRRRLTTLRRLEKQAQECTGQGRAGSGSVRKVLDARRGSKHKDSGLETRIARALAKAPIAKPMPQYKILDGRKVVARVDFAWPQAKIALECESYEFHSGRTAWKLDVTRLNEVTSLGWIVQRGTNEDADDPTALVRRLQRLLRERSLE